jgi:hypothetical protein
MKIKPPFRNFIIKNLFNENINFSKKYFNFFWDNLNAGGAGKSKAGVTETILGGFYKTGRNQEQSHVRTQKQIETQNTLKML